MLQCFHFLTPVSWGLGGPWRSSGASITLIISESRIYLNVPFHRPSETPGFGTFFPSSGVPISPEHSSLRKACKPHCQNGFRACWCSVPSCVSFPPGRKQTVPYRLKTTARLTGKSLGGPATLKPKPAGGVAGCSTCSDHIPSFAGIALPSKCWRTMPRWRCCS